MVSSSLHFVSNSLGHVISHHNLCHHHHQVSAAAMLGRKNKIHTIDTITYCIIFPIPLMTICEMKSIDKYSTKGRIISN